MQRYLSAFCLAVIVSVACSSQAAPPQNATYDPETGRLQTLTADNLTETFGVQIQLTEHDGRYAARAAH